MIPAPGFGTAPILGRVARAKGVEALAAAHAAGIRHFDTARSYGWGGAEAVLGDLLARVDRAEVTVVTKCGIVPVAQSTRLSVIKSVARRVMAIAPGLAPLVRRAASKSSYRPVQTYDLDVLKDSFETSLRQLRTDYVDVLLLHNFEAGREGLDAVVAWMRTLRADGRIREYGFSVERGLFEGLDFLEAQGLLEGAVIQVPVSAELLALPEKWSHVPIIAHGPFRFLSEQTDAGESRVADLVALLRLLGERCACRAVVCSMFSKGHIERNMATWTTARATPS